MAKQGLKPGWQVWRFDQMATNVNDRIDNPAEADVEHYVGLEHLDTDSLKIRRWGVPSDVEATKLRFRKGDIIFGRRRVYQRKLAVADFDGICSAHAMVLRAKPDVVLAEFLPFFMQSDLFMNRALEISVGSLSPTINWKTLAAQEFALPPLEEQRRIANRLIASSKLANQVFEAIRSGSTLLQGLIDSLISGANLSPKSASRLGKMPSSWQVSELIETFSDSLYGLSSIPLSEGQYPLLRMMNIEDGVVVENDLKYVDLPDEEFQRYRLVKGDVLFNRTNSLELVGRTGIYQLNGKHVFASYLVRVRTDPTKLLPEYLTEFLNSSLGRRQILSFATKGVSQANVNASNLGRVLIPLPSIDEQDKMIQEIAGMRSAIANLKSRYIRAGLLHTAFLSNALAEIA